LKALLIDSDILIEVLRARDHDLVARWESLIRSTAALFCSPVTIAELWHGARPQEYRSIEALFAAINCVPIDAQIGQRAGDFLRQFAKSYNVELGDALIAASASVHNLTVWTRNPRHYPMKSLSFY
jgi:predicted nucleic acid-binding protein